MTSKCWKRVRKLGIVAIGLVVATMAPHPALAQISSQGNDFIVGFLVNYYETPAVELHLTSSVNMQVQVEYPVGTNLGAPVALAPGAVTIVAIPANASMGWSAGLVQSNAVRAYSVDPTKEFTCYMINRIPYTSDAGLALPIVSLGNFYRVMMATPTIAGARNYSSEFVVVATQDATTVTITPKVTLSSGQPAGVPFNVALNRGQGWLAAATPSGVAGDLTGSTVQSDRPVSVTNGTGCVNIDCGACDHVFEVAQPVQTWGTGIPAANLPGFDTQGVRYRIMAAEDNTTVVQDGASIGVLNAGQFITTARLTGNHFFDGVEAGNPKPIFVMQLMPGCAQGICAGGDPAIGNMIPAAQYQNAYTFSTVGGAQFLCNYVTIIASNADVGALTLDGAPVAPASFSAIGTSGYSVARIAIASGSHRTVSPGPHGITVEGYNSYDSYLYPGGAALNPINVDLRLTKDDQVEDCILPGQTIDYEICYRNTGEDPSTNVSIVDALPAEVAFVSASGGGVYAAGPRTVTWSVAEAPAEMPAPVCFDLVASVNPGVPLGSEIVNRVDIDSEETDPIAVLERTPVCAEGENPAVDIQKTVYLGHDGGAGCPGGADLVDGVEGDPITYCFLVSNVGTTYLSPVAISDALLGITDADMTLLSGSIPLAPGATLVFSYETTAPAADLVNVAVVTATPSDEVGEPIPDQTDVTDSDQATVQIPLIVVLDSFTATVERYGVRIRWTTLSEIDTAGFRLLRGRPGEEPQLIPGAVIPSRGSELQGAAYEYVDVSVQGIGPVVYYLEDVDLHGKVTRDGSVQVNLTRPIARPRGKLGAPKWDGDRQGR